MLAAAAQALDTTSTMGEGTTRHVVLERASSNVILHAKGGKAGKETQVISYGKTAMLSTAETRKEKEKTTRFWAAGGIACRR